MPPCLQTPEDTGLPPKPAMASSGPADLSGLVDLMPGTPAVGIDRGARASPSPRAKLQALHARCAKLEADNAALRSQCDAKQTELAHVSQGHWAVAREEAAKLQESAVVAGLKAAIAEAHSVNAKLMMTRQELLAEKLRLNRVTKKALLEKDEQSSRADEAIRGKEEAEADAVLANARAEKALADRAASKISEEEAHATAAQALAAKVEAELTADKAASQATIALASQQAAAEAERQAKAQAELAQSRQQVAEKSAEEAEVRAAKAVHDKQAAEEAAQAADTRAAEATKAREAAEAAVTAAETKAAAALRSHQAALAAAQRAAQTKTDEALRQRESARQESQQAHTQAARAQRQNEITQKAADNALARLMHIVSMIESLDSGAEDGLCWEVHEAAWTLFEKRTSSVKLTKADIPWPPCPAGQNVLTAAVQAAGLSALSPKFGESVKALYGKLLKRWHPDKFLSKFSVSEDRDEQAAVKLELNAIQQSLREGYGKLAGLGAA